MSEINLQNLLDALEKAQSSVQTQLAEINKSSAGGTVDVGKFMKLQFMMSQMTSVGEACSNVVAQLNSLILKSIGNFRSQ